MTHGQTFAARRIGGEIPAFTSRLGPAQNWDPGWLPFSHGRAALGWLIEQRSIRSVLCCAYTCPSVPAFVSRRQLTQGAFDVGASIDRVVGLAQQLPAPRMVLLPALFGTAPWLDANAVQSALPADDVVVIDAAQSAFGHADFGVPDGGAVLSGPRKTTDLADGAVLALSQSFGKTAVDIADLPRATLPAATKAAARALWATGDAALEGQALAYHQQSEQSWPDAPHRMTEQSRVLLEHMDRAWHTAVRQSNRDALADMLKHRIPMWTATTGTPFNLPIFAGNREHLLAELRSQRIFATALWPDARLDRRQHPCGAWMADHLIGLPVDQRHDALDMQRLAAAVAASAKAPAAPSPPSLEPFIA